MINHEETGYLARSKDVDDLARGIQWAITLPDPDIVSSKCRSSAEKRFSLEIQAKAYLEKYKSLLTGEIRLLPTSEGQSYPKISVVTPSFNQAQYIEKTIQSVIQQDYPNFEHIVIDGGSTDGTIEILKKYAHLKWISEKDRGQSDALNKGLKSADGEIIAWIDSDDWYEQDTFSAVARFFLGNQDKNVVMGDCNLVDEHGNIFDHVINVERGFEELTH